MFWVSSYKFLIVSCNFFKIIDNQIVTKKIFLLILKNILNKSKKPLFQRNNG
jgi:hypothetical protein